MPILAFVPPPNRRQVLQSVLACTLPAASWAARPTPEPPHDHFPFGVVAPPRPLGRQALLLHDGQSAELAALLRGQTTAVQLMFTGCSASCPIQGALFAQAQALAARQAVPAQFLSLSVDALGDTPGRLQSWLRQFGAARGWRAAVPRRVADVDAITRLLGEGGQGVLSAQDPHNGQVHIIDRHGRLAYRTAVTPTAADIVLSVRKVLHQTG